MTCSQEKSGLVSMPFVWIFFIFECDRLGPINILPFAKDAKQQTIKWIKECAIALGQNLALESHNNGSNSLAESFQFLQILLGQFSTHCPKSKLVQVMYVIRFSTNILLIFVTTHSRSLKFLSIKPWYCRISFSVKNWLKISMKWV